MLNIRCPNCQSVNWIYSGYAKPKKGEVEKPQQFYCKDCQTTFTDKKILDQFPDVDLELLRENIRLAKRTQRFADSNRIERKAFREYARVDNAVSEYNQELVKVLDQYNPVSYTHLTLPTILLV